MKDCCQFEYQEDIQILYILYIQKNAKVLFAETLLFSYLFLYRSWNNTASYKRQQRNRLYVCIYFHQNTILIIVAVVFILFEKIMTCETVL